MWCLQNTTRSTPQKVVDSGSAIDTVGTIDIYVDLRVQAAWSSWWKFTGLLNDRNTRILKAKIYEAIIRPALTYRSESWAMKVNNTEEEVCYHGDDNGSWDPLNVETGPHAKGRNSTHISPYVVALL